MGTCIQAQHLALLAAVPWDSALCSLQSLPAHQYPPTSQMIPALALNSISSGELHLRSCQGGVEADDRISHLSPKGLDLEVYQTGSETSVCPGSVYTSASVESNC